MNPKEQFIQILERKLEECPEWLRPQLRISLIQEFEEKYEEGFCKPVPMTV